MSTITYGNSNIVVSSAGERTMPLQPAFCAYLASTDTNVTGHGTSYVVGTNTALTERFDQNADFNTNGIFTAPVTGRFSFDNRFFVTGTTTANLFNVFLDTSNFNYLSQETRADSNRDESISSSVLTDMDSGDTAFLRLAVGGEAADTADLLGNGSAGYTTFSGSLIC